ncbi:hypothetical protein C7S20_13895 [Christiangramia fulva]|uniref:Uncharacterized protein n=1 Tax=Christiangramia fulva TaxID=2126553 RepID=A0A2R3Z7M8_9FLAO|nr:hypothetical protein [Christiangramia fulva]AVR46266.1 hypothetical protein C7S20_13895 [Christiangramia fulva]
MRFTNRNEIKVVPSIYIVLVAVFITNIFVNIEVALSSDSEQHLTFGHILPNIVTLVLALYIHRIGQTFDFDSDGETLNFKNNGVFFSKFMEYRVKKAEFPKRKLGKFKFVDYGIYSALTIYIRSRRKRGFRKYTFNTTFLTRKKKKGMVNALNKVLETTPKVTA